MRLITQPISQEEVSDERLGARRAEEEFRSFIGNPVFPCVAAKAALTKDQMDVFVAGHIACPKDDRLILEFLHRFVDRFREAETQFHTACVLFPEAQGLDEKMFERLLWMRLQALSDLDIQHHSYDSRVSADPASDQFSFSIKSEAFFVIGLHPASSREARRFAYPAIVFNPHAQFEELRTLERYEKMKNIVRKRDVALCGTINPMLQDFGTASEAYQYSGMKYDSSWKCPFRPNLS